jgi:twitching motility protein PilT
MDLDAFQKLLSVGIQYGASDIHFRPGDPPTYRVNGTLAPLKVDKLKAADTRAIALHVIRDPAIREKIDNITEYDTSYSLPGVSRFRVNIYRQRGTLAMVLRIIPADIPTVENLGLPPVITEIAETERGLILVTGATGSGKSSTLAAMINHINQTRRVHIVTIEDPIEYLYTNGKASISQREIGIDTGDFTVALRAALRQDPDVILVGEMRDAISMDIALKAAETGHVVFATVHTTDASKTIGRLLSVFPADEQQMVRFRLADNLRATVSQRLLPRADGKGRVVAAEIMIATAFVQDAIRDPSKTGSLVDIIQQGRLQYHMQTFDQHLTELYRAGYVSLQTAVEAATSPSDFQRALMVD